MNLMPYVISWGVLATVVVVLAIYRRGVAGKEDDYVHIEGGKAVEQQVAVGKKLDAIDKWGKGLTILVAVYALVIGGLFMYKAWLEGSSIQY